MRSCARQRLRFDAAAVFGLIELIGRKFAELFVRFVQLQFAVADFECDMVPTGELFSHPDSMLFRAEDVKSVRGRIDTLAVGEIIFDEDAELDRLRFDAERFAQKVPDSSSEVWSQPPAPSMDSPVAGFSVDWGAERFPGHADLTNAEIVVCFDFEEELLAVEENFLTRQIFDGDRGGLVFVRDDREFEGVFAGQAELVLPLDGKLLGSVDRGFGDGDDFAVELGRLIINLPANGAGGSPWR